MIQKKERKCVLSRYANHRAICIDCGEEFCQYTSLQIRCKSCQEKFAQLSRKKMNELPPEKAAKRRESNRKSRKKYEQKKREEREKIKKENESFLKENWDPEMKVAEQDTLNELESFIKSSIDGIKYELEFVSADNKRKAMKLLITFEHEIRNLRGKKEDEYGE